MFQSVYLLEVKQSRVFKRGEAPLPTSPSPLKERGIKGVRLTTNINHTVYNW